MSFASSSSSDVRLDKISHTMYRTKQNTINATDMTNGPYESMKKVCVKYIEKCPCNVFTKKALPEKNTR